MIKQEQERKLWKWIVAIGALGSGLAAAINNSQTITNCVSKGLGCFVSTEADEPVPIITDITALDGDAPSVRGTLTDGGSLAITIAYSGDDQIIVDEIHAATWASRGSLEGGSDRNVLLPVAITYRIFLPSFGEARFKLGCPLVLGPDARTARFVLDARSTDGADDSLYSLRLRYKTATGRTGFLPLAANTDPGVTQVAQATIEWPADPTSAQRKDREYEDHANSRYVAGNPIRLLFTPRTSSGAIQGQWIESVEAVTHLEIAEHGDLKDLSDLATFSGERKALDAAVRRIRALLLSKQSRNDPRVMRIARVLVDNPNTSREEILRMVANADPDLVHELTPSAAAPRQIFDQALSIARRSLQTDAGRQWLEACRGVSGRCDAGCYSSAVSTAVCGSQYDEYRQGLELLRALARNEAAGAKLLGDVMRGGFDPFIAEFVQHLESEAQITALKDHESCSVRLAVARNWQTPETTVAELASDSCAPVGEAATERLHMPKTLDGFSQDGPSEITKVSQKSRDLSTARSSSDEKVLISMSTMTDLEIVAEVARNPHTPTITLAVLSNHSNSQVRLGVAVNRATSHEIVEKLSLDPNPQVRAAALRTFQDSPALLDRLAAEIDAFPIEGLRRHALFPRDDQDRSSEALLYDYRQLLAKWERIGRMSPARVGLDNVEVITLRTPLECK